MEVDPGTGGSNSIPAATDFATVYSVMGFGESRGKDDIGFCGTSATTSMRGSSGDDGGVGFSFNFGGSAERARDGLSVPNTIGLLDCVACQCCTLGGTIQSEKSIGGMWILADVTPKCSAGDGKREVE